MLIHFVFLYAALIWIYTTAKEIVNVILAFGVVFQVGSLILGVTILAIGIGMQDLVTCVGVARADIFFCLFFFLVVVVFWRTANRHAKDLVTCHDKITINSSSRACRCLPPPLRRSCYAPAEVDGQACHSAD